jgi:dihydrolipoamide dehydrogenase
MKKKFDVIVIGAGPAGYVAAIRCAQLGLNVACVDQWIDDSTGAAVLGGTCLNVGCIPSKALLESSENYEAARLHFTDHGVGIGELSLDLNTMMARKSRIVTDLTSGVATLFKANGVVSILGRGRLLDNSHVEVVQDNSRPDIYEADNIILATGSSPVEIDAAPLSEHIVDSTGALAFTKVPGRLGIIGAGVIGLELGSVWRRLGSSVVLFEAQDTFLSIADDQIANEALRQFTRQGLDIRLGARVASSAIKRGKVTLEYTDGDGTHTEKFDKLIVAVGRLPNTNNLCADESRLLLDEWGLIHVDEQCRTNLPNVYAIGDVVRGPMLAHKGSEEGIMVAELICGNHASVNYDIIPSVIYTSPEVAWAGRTEKQLKSEGVAYTAGVFPFSANGRARAHGDSVGVVKVLADKETDRVLGVHMIGPGCSELISQAVIAMEFGASSEDIGLTVFAHPTLSETFHEAAMDARGNAIHIARKRSRK